MNKSQILAGIVLAATAPLAGAQTTATPPAGAQSTAAPAAADALVVVRDAATGALRAPTAAELSALQASRGTSSLRSAPAVPLQKFSRTGAVGARLTNDFMSHTVLVRQPDGKLVEQCFDSKEAAEAAAKGGMFATPISLAKQLPTE